MEWDGVDYTRMVQERNNELQGSVRCSEVLKRALLRVVCCPYNTM